MTKQYSIKRWYRARTRYHHYDDLAVKDEWQLEVYLHALELMRKHGLTSVVDVGCGSGYKLVTHFSEYETVGMELQANVDVLRERYPDRRWQVSDFSAQHEFSADLVVCADVIEHLVDPDELLGFIEGLSFRYLVLSTPDRDLIYRPWQRGYFGPPRNKAHAREWSFKEFATYISQRFNIVEHRVTNRAQRTQMIVCEKVAVC